MKNNSTKQLSQENAELLGIIKQLRAEIVDQDEQLSIQRNQIERLNDDLSIQRIEVERLKDHALWYR